MHPVNVRWNTLDYLLGRSGEKEKKVLWLFEVSDRNYDGHGTHKTAVFPILSDF